jgi:urease accessory protein
VSHNIFPGDSGIGVAEPPAKVNRAGLSEQVVVMSRTTRLLPLAGAAVALALAQPAEAHHVMGGAMPVTWMQGLLSGLGHPIIGFDHLAAVLAMGCLAAAHRAGIGLLAGFVTAMVAGAALHVRGATVPAPEILVALSVIALGVAMQLRSKPGLWLTAVLFALAGAINGYALGESIAGAEPAPLYAYFVGLALVQLGVAAMAMGITRSLVMCGSASVPLNLRLVGAAVIVAGLGAATLQLVAA